MKRGYYTFFFWFIWISTMPLVLRIIPDGSELLYVIAYPIIGFGLYFTIPLVFAKCFSKIEDKRHQRQRAAEQNKELFLKEQYLRKKYRYIKLNNKENIINNNAIDKKDKILLLEIIHGLTYEEITNLLKKTV